MLTKLAICTEPHMYTCHWKNGVKTPCSKGEHESCTTCTNHYKIDLRWMIGVITENDTKPWAWDISADVYWQLQQLFIQDGNVFEEYDILVNQESFYNFEAKREIPCYSLIPVEKSINRDVDFEELKAQMTVNCKSYQE